MTYPFVSDPDNWPRTAPVRAIVIHHAEGGGTVRHLVGDSGNSSHYVVEYTGRIVQMVRENRAAGSIDPTKVRRNDDPAFEYLGEQITYGITANKECLGPNFLNPNAAVIAIEVEGFARVGPNAAQRGSLRTLVADIRTRFPGLPTLGHRDFQAYKACPGKRIPWADYGGHGRTPVTPEADEMLTFTLDETKSHHGKVEVTIDDALAIRLDDGEPIPVKKGETKEHGGFGKTEKPIGTGSGAQADRHSGWLLYGSRPAWLLAYAAREVPVAATDTEHTVSLAVDGAVVYQQEV